MSMDAYATGAHLQYIGHPDGTTEIQSPELRAAFASAVRQVRLAVGKVDGNLETAGLDCTKSVQFLARATGLDLRNAAWDAQDVAEIAAKANWDFCVDDDEQVYYLSACAFLNTCADNHLGISFN